MPGELSALAAALWSMARLRADRWFGAHVLREPMARLHTRSGVADPYPIYRRLREQGAFVRSRSGARVTARYECCQMVLRSRDFGVRPPGVPVPQADMDLGMLDRDPPDHGRLRKLAAPAFTPRAVEGYLPLVEDAADRLLTEAGRTGPFDLVEGYAAPLPVTIITALLGLDGADAAAVARHGAAITSMFDGIRSPAHLMALQRAAGELHATLSRTIEQRRRDPGEDLVSALVAAESDGRVSEYDLMVMCHLLLVAGFETTVNLIGNAVSALLDRPELWTALRDDPGLAGAAAEEVLRFDPPVQMTDRIAHVDTELAGERFRAGDGVTLLLAGAGRDPSVFADPDTPDLDRPQAPGHLAFSAGIHYCLGAPLARLEAEVALRRLAERMPALSRAGRATWRPTITIRGRATLPVRP